MRQLETLVRSGARESFAAAADALNFTPSAVSHQMARLEEEAGVSLIERVPRGAHLTAAGEVLLARSKSIFESLERADENLRLLMDGGSGRLRVGSFPTATAGFVAEALRALGSRFPNIALELKDGEPYESAARLKTHELDVAVIFELDLWPASTDYDGRPVCSVPKIHCDHLFDDPFLLVAPAAHRLVSEGPCALADLADELILGSPTGCPPWGPDLRRACRHAGVELRFEDCYRSADVAYAAWSLTSRARRIQPLVCPGRQAGGSKPGSTPPRGSRDRERGGRVGGGDLTQRDLS